MIYLILLLAFILRVWNLNQSFWLDEAAQAIESSQGIPAILSGMAADFHPPLFHLLMHFWLILGKEEWIMRLLPVAFGLGSIFVVYLLAREMFSKKVALISALLLSINPFHIYYSQELRPYMAGLFFTVLSSYLLWKSLKGNSRWWAALAISNAALFYTSYFSVFILVAQLIYLVWSKINRPHLIKFFMSTTASVLLFLPWFPQIFSQLEMSRGFAADLPGWKDAVATPVYKALPLTFVKFIIGQINFRPLEMYALISVSLISLWGYLIFRSINFRDEAWKYLLSLSAFGLILPVLFSLFLQIASPKRLIYALPFIILLLAYGLDKLKVFQAKIFLISLVAVNLLCLAIYQFTPIHQREDWRGAISEIEKDQDKSLVVFKFSAPFAPYLWYSKGKMETFSISRSLALDEAYLTGALPAVLSGKEKVFIFQYLEDLTDKKRLTEREVEKAGFIKSRTLDYPGVGFIYEYIR